MYTHLTVRSLMANAVIGPEWGHSCRMKVILLRSQRIQVASAEPDTTTRYVFEVARQTTKFVWPYRT